MNCKNPIIVANPAWTPRNGEPRGFKVPCGKCMACRIAKRGEWVTRLICEHSYWPDSAFITLTYSDENLPDNGTLVKADLQKFFKRLRKKLNKDIKYYACGEYGDKTSRPHYHAIVFGLDYLDGRQVLPEVWFFGRTSSDPVTSDSIRYVAGYVEKKMYGDFAKEEYDIVGSRPTSEGRAVPVYRLLPPFSLSSQGLGKRYALEHQDEILRCFGVTFHGRNLGFPRYFRKVLGVDKEIMYEKAIEAEFESDARIIARGVSLEFVGNYKAEACRHFDTELHRKKVIFGGRDKI